jgi:Outer membrane protein beta-barrel domain
MKKIILAFVFSCFCSFAIHAQWGIKAGINYSAFSVGTSAPKLTWPGHAGITYDKQISGNWYFQPALLVTSWGAEYNRVFRGHARMYGLELPLNISFRPKIGDTGFNVVTDFGLYARCGLFGKRKYTDPFVDAEEVEESSYNKYKRFDMGLNLGLGLQKGRIYGIVSCALGLTSVSPNSDARHESYRLSLGYRFKN